MLITRKSPFSGETHTLDINVTQEQIDDWQNGNLIQNAMPHLSVDDREFLMTGVTKEEWDKEFKDHAEADEVITDEEMEEYDDAIIDDMQDDNDEDGDDDDLK